MQSLRECVYIRKRAIKNEKLGSSQKDSERHLFLLQRKKQKLSIHEYLKKAQPFFI